MREWLKYKRMKLNMSQAQVAEKSGIARTTYAMIESGERNPSTVVAKRIAKVLKVGWTLFYA